MEYRIATNGVEFRIEKHVLAHYGFLWIKSRFVWKPVDRWGDPATKNKYAGYGDTYYNWTDANTALNYILDIKRREAERKTKLHNWAPVDKE